MTKEVKKYTESQARQIWKAGQEYWKSSGATITFEELTEKMNGGATGIKINILRKEKSND